MRSCRQRQRLDTHLRNLGSKEKDEKLSRLIEAISTEQARLHEALARLDAPPLPKPEIIASPMETQHVLEHLKTLLAMDDAEANILFSTSGTLLQQTFGAMAEQLGQQIETFDYSAALKTIERMSVSVADKENPTP